MHNILFGIDFGMKRIGVAIGQTVTKTARPLETLQANQGEPDWLVIDKLIKKWNPDAIVIGIPLNMDGTEQQVTMAARRFAKELRNHTNIKIYKIDERLTTKEARDRLFDEGGYKALQGGQIDQIAAQLILENWFAENGSDN